MTPNVLKAAERVLELRKIANTKTMGLYNMKAVGRYRDYTASEAPAIAKAVIELTGKLEEAARRLEKCGFPDLAAALRATPSLSPKEQPHD